MVKAILFDCYGTLVDTGNGSVKAAERILSINNSAANADEFYMKWKQLHHEICRTEPFMTEAAAFLQSLEQLYEMYSIQGNALRDVDIMLNTLSQRVVYPEVRETLATLANTYELVIGSNSDHDPLLLDIAKNRIPIDKAYSSESLRVYKPNALFFERMLSDLKLEAHEVIYVGDSQTDDIEGSARAGIRNIWINRKRDTFTGAIMPTYECADLRGIFEWIYSNPTH